ncbi:MAG TPA: sulfur carrier protein ThiS [Actinomycetota bacterium]|nr:sulfur carrier protein ThiS [Actinomycetota bacterium]
MTVIVNGTTTSMPEDATVSSVVATITKSPRGVAVALNGEVVPRSEWAGRRIDEGDRVEVLTAVGGG